MLHRGWVVVCCSHQCWSVSLLMAFFFCWRIDGRNLPEKTDGEEEQEGEEGEEQDVTKSPTKNIVFATNKLLNMHRAVIIVAGLRLRGLMMWKMWFRWLFI